MRINNQLPSRLLKKTHIFVFHQPASNSLAYFISRSVCRDALIHLLYESLMYWVARPRREPSFYDNESIEPANRVIIDLTLALRFDLHGRELPAQAADAPLVR